MIMLCMEWVSFEISTFVVGSLGEVPLAANICGIEHTDSGLHGNNVIVLYIISCISDTTGCIHFCISTSRQ